MSLVLAHDEGRRRRKLPLIEESEIGDRPVVRAAITYEETTLIRMEHEGAPAVTLECGNCGTGLVEGMELSELPDLVFVCTVCGAWNGTSR